MQFDINTTLPDKRLIENAKKLKTINFYLFVFFPQSHPVLLEAGRLHLQRH